MIVKMFYLSGDTIWKDIIEFNGVPEEKITFLSADDDIVFAEESLSFPMIKGDIEKFTISVDKFKDTERFVEFLFCVSDEDEDKNLHLKIGTLIKRKIKDHPEFIGYPIPIEGNNRFARIILNYDYEKIAKEYMALYNKVLQ